MNNVDLEKFWDTDSGRYTCLFGELIIFVVGLLVCKGDGKSWLWKAERREMEELCYY